MAMTRSLVTLVLLFLSAFAAAFQQSPAGKARGAQSVVRLHVGPNDYLSTIGQAQESFPNSEYTSSEQSTAHDEFDVDAAVALAKACEVAYGQDYRIANWAENHGYEFYQVFQVNDLFGFMSWSDSRALLCFRGSANPYNWLRNLKVDQTQHEWGLVHRGFHEGIYSEEMTNVMKVFQDIAQEKQVTITGHSLGGALAVLAATRFKIESGLSPSLYTFGQPLVGNDQFADRFMQELPNNLYRVINKKDIVPRIPPTAAGYSHCGHPKRLSDTRISKMFGTSQAEQVPAVEGAANILPNFGHYFDSQSSNWRSEPPVHVKENDLQSLSMEEFEALQESLGPRDYIVPYGVLGDHVPYFNDHKISEYIEMLQKLSGADDGFYEVKVGGL
jgi:triacylglycerol lipase